MSSLFSSFTLYESYLVIMYDLRQSLQLIKHTSNHCLEKTYKSLKQKIHKRLMLKFLNI